LSTGQGRPEQHFCPVSSEYHAEILGEHSEVNRISILYLQRLIEISAEETVAISA